MKLKDSEKCALIVIAGIAVLALSIMYIVKPNIEEIQSLTQECETLQVKLADLQQKEAKRDEYLAGIDTYNDKFNAVMSAFPPDLNQEVTIMFLQGIKDNNEFEIDNLTLGQKEQFYTLGLNGADASLDDGTGAAASDTGSTEASTEATTEASTEAAAPTDGELVEGEAPLQEGTYACYRATFPIVYNGSYESLKDVVNYVDNFSSRMAIDSVDISYDADNDTYTGNMNLQCYSIESPDRPETSMELNDVEIGVDNIFEGGTSGNSDDTKLTKYDENEGAEIVSNYDFYAMLNPSTSDVSAKLLGQNGTGKEGTVVTGGDNSVSVVNYDFYEKEGKNYCKYTLDGTSYEAEVTSAEDVKLLLRSSTRKDEDDKVGIRVTIRNTTTLPVYVKVADDDAVSPRINIVSKTGAVKVYK